MYSTKIKISNLNVITCFILKNIIKNIVNLYNSANQCFA